MNRRPRHPQNAGRLDLRLAGGEHPAGFGQPGTRERLRPADMRPALPRSLHAGDGTLPQPLTVAASAIAGGFAFRPLAQALDGKRFEPASFLPARRRQAQPDDDFDYDAPGNGIRDLHPSRHLRFEPLSA